MRYSNRAPAILLLLAAIIPAHLLAQSTSARIVGTVTDAFGAVQPRVTVKITNLETNAVRLVTTNEAGDYSVLNLPIGNYEIAVEQSGFKRHVQRPIKLDVDQTARIDVRLEVGQVSESVTVEASAPLIESERSGIGQVVENKTIVQLPLNGRNFIRLGSLIPGTTRGAPGNSTLRSRQENEALTANGQRPEYNNYTLDGIDNNETNLGLAVLIPSVDAIQEFKVQTANYSAEFGRAAGAIINVAIKSGGNELRGTAYDFMRNDIFDARNPFSLTKDPLRRNQFGGTIGGPVELPRPIFGPLAYRGINRTFFFFSYEGLRERRSSTKRFMVPTAAQRNGDFSGLPTIYDPFDLVGSGNAASRVAFPNNRIPADRISPIAQRVLNFYPLPNNSDPASNYLEQFSDPIDGDQIQVRGDHALTAKDQLMLRYSWSNRANTTRTIAFNGETTFNRPRGAVIGYTRTFSSTVVNEFRFGTQRYSFDFLPEGLGVDGISPLGLPAFGASGNLLRYPTISIRNLTSFGGNAALPVVRAENTFQWLDNLSFVFGRHSMKLGGEIRRFQFNNFQPQTSAGNYSFTGAFTGVRGSQYANGLADFLLGLPLQEQILNTAGYHPTYLRNTRVSLYLQDDYQVAPRLTLNLGLRWERDGNWTEKYDRWAYFDFETAQVVYPKTAQIPFTTFPYPFRFDGLETVKQPTNKALAPRIGLAFRPFNDNSTVIRSAFGIFWGQSEMNPIGNTVATPPPFFLRQTVTSGTTTPELRFGVFPGTSPSQLLPAIPSFFTLDPDQFSNGYVQQWNLGIERQLFRDLAVKASYVGSRGNRLNRRYEGNPALPPGAGSVQSRRRYPNFGSITFADSNGFSTYHSLQLSAEKRFSQGLQFLAGYTWSKSLDTTSSWGGLGSENFLPQDPANLFLEKGRSAFDLSHRFTLSFVYELPLRLKNKALNGVLGGWQVNGIVTVQTGFPFTVLASGDIPNIGAGTGNTRANLVGDPRVDHPTIDRWFNPNAFAQPAAFTYGTAGRNILNGPGRREFDFSMMKVFSFNERHRLQFRAEFFNFLNHPNYGLPNAQVGNTAFATIRSADNREMQFGLKYIF